MMNAAVGIYETDVKGLVLFVALDIQGDRLWHAHELRGVLQAVFNVARAVPNAGMRIAEREGLASLRRFLVRSQNRRFGVIALSANVPVGWILQVDLNLAGCCDARQTTQRSKANDHSGDLPIAHAGFQFASA